MHRKCLGGALSNVLDFPQNASHICDVFVCVPYIRSSWCSTVKTMFAQDDSRSIFDVPLACWIQLCFVRLHRNKMTVITSETIVLYFNLITHWQSYTQKRIMNFEKKYVACVASVSSRVRRESWDESKKKKKGRGRGRGMKEPRFLFSPHPPPSTFFFLLLL